jgi:hypothetical protein
VLWVMGVWREQLSPLAAVLPQWFMETYPPQVTYNAYYTELMLVLVLVLVLVLNRFQWVLHNYELNCININTVLYSLRL